MDKIARVYAEALFQVAREKGKLDAIREHLGQFVDVLQPATATCRSSSSAPTSPLARSARAWSARSRGRIPS